MSSTNRGGVREASDYYATPHHTIREFLAAIVEHEPEFPLAGEILDPCAGGDAVRAMAYPSALEAAGASSITTLDIRGDSRAETITDFLAWQSARRFDLVITNPPFAIAVEVIEKALEVTRAGGYVVMLLRLNILGAQSRKSFWQMRAPRFVFVHSKRPKFTDARSGDSCEYAHFVWRVGEWTAPSSLVVI